MLKLYHGLNKVSSINDGSPLTMMGWPVSDCVGVCATIYPTGLRQVQIYQLIKKETPVSPRGLPCFQLLIPSFQSDCSFLPVETSTFELLPSCSFRTYNASPLMFLPDLAKKPFSLLPSVLTTSVRELGRLKFLFQGREANYFLPSPTTDFHSPEKRPSPSFFCPFVRNRMLGMGLEWSASVVV